MIERTQKPAIQGRIPLPNIEEEEVAPIEIATDILDTKREAFNWPLDTKERFDEITRNGYIFDHEFSDAERRAYLKTHPDALPFASRLYVPGTDLIVMGKNSFEPPKEPIFEEKTRVQEWNDALLAGFIAKKDQVFATLNADRKFSLSRMKMGEGPLKRDVLAKRFTPIVCGTGDYAKENTSAVSIKMDKNGKGITGSFVINGKAKPVKSDTMCMYVELLAREENNCFWLTPEEYSVLYDGAGSKKDQTNQYKFTQAFKK
jgi:hypothetical protein